MLRGRAESRTNPGSSENSDLPGAADQGRPILAGAVIGMGGGPPQQSCARGSLAQEFRIALFVAGESSMLLR